MDRGRPNSDCTANYQQQITGNHVADTGLTSGVCLRVPLYTRVCTCLCVCTCAFKSLCVFSFSIAYLSYLSLQGHDILCKLYIDSA